MLLNFLVCRFNFLGKPRVERGVDTGVQNDKRAVVGDSPYPEDR